MSQQANELYVTRRKTQTTITDTEDASPIGKKLSVGEHNKIRNSETTVTNPFQY